MLQYACWNAYGRYNHEFPCNHIKIRYTEMNHQRITTCCFCGEVLDVITMSELEKKEQKTRWLIVEENGYPSHESVEQFRQKVLLNAEEVQWSEYPVNRKAWSLLADTMQIEELVSHSDCVAIFGMSPKCKTAALKAKAQGKTVRWMGKVGEDEEGYALYGRMSIEQQTEALANQKEKDREWLDSLSDEFINSRPMPFGSLPDWNDPETIIDYKGERLDHTPILLIDSIVGRNWCTGTTKLIMEEYLRRHKVEQAAAWEDAFNIDNQENLSRIYQDAVSGEWATVWIDPDDQKAWIAEHDLEEEDRQQERKGNPLEGYGRNYDEKLEGITIEGKKQ